ncbi:ABC transporter permease [Bosea psychrotolerans]|uniref:Peptide/nickel transport system permease protein n=1 Tax=Bosea psychrotolerans TaxID=1871628 RepID=A0A2S4LWX5_9HYPH|nr:ABC transporter permease [Bosea psychrotolerans]POR46956.1 peptide/nickel transport system permease protein [Bosea psychrotolerans]
MGATMIVRRRRLSASSLALGFNLAVVGVVLGCALLAPPLLGYSSDLNMAEALQPPGAAHWFGTDNLGRDIFVRTVSGARTSLLVGLGVSALTLTAGGAIGLLAGYVRTVDSVTMRIMDGFMAIPGVLLAIALASLLGSGLVTVMIAISVPEIPRTARLMRSVVLSLREMPYVDAAVSIGSSTPRVLFRHILPNATEALVVQATFICASAILAEAVLSFLGVGISPDLPSWGNVIAGGRQFFRVAPWIIAFPGLFLSLLVLAVNLLGDVLRERIDPRLAARRAS